MAAALVVGMPRCVKETVVVIPAAELCGGARALAMAAVIASARAGLVVLPAVLERDAEHPTRSGRDRRLHDQQEQGDELEKGGRHRVGVYRLG